MAISWDRLRGAIGRLRGVVDIQDQLDSTGYLNVPREKMETYVQMAAQSCTWLCRSMIKGNMLAAGIKSDGLSSAIDMGEAVYWKKRGVVRFRLAAKFNPYKERNTKGEGGVWMVAASQDAGRVLGLKGIQAGRAKRQIKRGLADARTARKITQVHDGRIITREAITLSKLSVVPGKKFFEFSAGQSAQIVAHFKKNLDGLLKKNGYR